MFTLDPPGFDSGYIGWLDWLGKWTFDSTATAPVILGRDEGSQRSGETLAARALPTVTSVYRYRNSFAEAINLMARHALLCMSLLPSQRNQSTNINGISKEDILGYRFNVDWPSVLPRERREIVENETLLYQAGLRSLPLALHMLGDVRNVTKEAEAIEAEAEAEAERNKPPLPLGSSAVPGAAGPKKTSSSQPKKPS